MKKQQLNKALIFLLVVIWSVLIYKYVSPYLIKQNVKLKAFQIENKEPNNFFEKDTFQLKISSYDPFLNNYYTTKKQAKVNYKPKLKKTSQDKNKVWPRINYLGFVKSNSNKHPLVLIRVDGKLHKVHRGEKLKNLQIIKVKEDSIQLKFSGQLKYFKR